MKIKLKEFEEVLLDEERSSNTIDAYTRSVRIFFERYEKVSKQNMLAFKKWQMEKWKPKTANNRIAAMNKYCEFIGKPECKVRGVKIHQNSVVENVISIEEYNKLLQELQEDGNEKGYWMIQYLAKTGARVSEFINLTKDALDKGYCEMWTKGKIRRIYIPEELINESRDFFDNSDSKLLFVNKNGKKYTAKGIASNIKRWAKKYGIRDEVAHPHAFRHLYAIEFLKRNSNIALLADLMGHSSVQTTSIYLRLSQQEQQKQLNEAMRW